jgi:hypothetical protein
MWPRCQVGQETPARGAVETSFVSQIGDNSTVLEILRLTEISDELQSPILST